MFIITATHSDLFVLEYILRMFKFVLSINLRLKCMYPNIQHSICKNAQHGFAWCNSNNDNNNEMEELLKP